MGIVINPVLPPVSAVDAPLVANTVNESSLLGAGGLCTFLAGTLNEGSTIRMTMFGKFSNRAAAPGNITLQAKLGGALVWSSGALAMPAALHTDITFFLDLMLMFRPGSKVMGAGKLEAALSSSQTDFFLPSTNPVDSAALDLNVDRDLDVTAKFSVADVGNKIQLLGLQVLC